MKTSYPRLVGRVELPPPILTYDDGYTEGCLLWETHGDMAGNLLPLYPFDRYRKGILDGFNDSRDQFINEYSINLNKIHSVK